MPQAHARPPFDADLVRSRLPALGRVEVVPATGSTNDDLVAALRADPGAWPDRSLLVADHQTAGRGRVGRGWQTPAGTAVTCSFVVRPADTDVPLGWLPLAAGLGAVTAIRAATGVPAALKWPNDLLVPAADDVEGWGRHRKVGGILTEVVPGVDGPAAVVVGTGLNVLQEADELPVPWATSLALAGGRRVDRTGLLVALVGALDETVGRWRAARGDAVRSGLAAEVAQVCATLGSRVAVEEPSGGVVTGTADRLDDDGALVVLTDDGTAHRALAGDVRHVRTGDLPSQGVRVGGGAGAARGCGPGREHESG